MPETSWLDWLTAIGTMLAALVPAALFLVERKDRKAAESETRELRERERRESAEREAADAESRARSQAELVHVWPAKVQDAVDVFVVSVAVVNASSMPVTWVQIGGTVAYPDGPGKKLLYGMTVLPPTGGEVRYHDLATLLPMDGEGYDPHDESDPEPELFLISSVTFTDAFGVDWERTVDGFVGSRLKRLDTGPKDDVENRDFDAARTKALPLTDPPAT